MGEGPRSQRGESRRPERRGRTLRGGAVSGEERAQRGAQRGFSGRGGGRTLLDELQGLLPLPEAELAPLLRLVQIVHRDDRGGHADHVLLPAARGRHNEVLQPLAIDGVLCHLGHWGPCSQGKGRCSSKETRHGVRRVGAAHSVPRLSPARAKESGTAGPSCFTSGKIIPGTMS